MHFVWFITDFGIAAILKGNEKFKIYDLNAEKEAKILVLISVRKKENILKLRIKNCSFFTLDFN